MNENNGFTKEYLEELRALPLDAKILKSKQRIREWYNYFGGQVYVSFSGGKDSTVLLHLVRSVFPDVPAVYCDTGLEYPELKEHVRMQENVTILRPKMPFNEVITKYGYPIVGKEVAEAIYYARRILPEDLSGHMSEGRERESITPVRKRKELLGQRETRSTFIKRAELVGQYRNSRQATYSYLETVLIRKNLTGARGQTSEESYLQETGRKAGVTEPG